MKAIEQYFHTVLFIMLYKLVLTFNSVDKTLVYEDLWSVLDLSILCQWLFDGTEKVPTVTTDIRRRFLAAFEPPRTRIV